MEFDNATNLDRKSGVRGTKKTGEAHRRFFLGAAENREDCTEAYSNAAGEGGLGQRILKWL